MAEAIWEAIHIGLCICVATGGVIFLALYTMFGGDDD